LFCAKDTSNHTPKKYHKNVSPESVRSIEIYDSRHVTKVKIFSYNCFTNIYTIFVDDNLMNTI